MTTTVQVDIVSAEQEIFSGLVEMIFAPAELGELGTSNSSENVSTRMLWKIRFVLLLLISFIYIYSIIYIYIYSIIYIRHVAGKCVERICECSSAAFPWGNIDFIVEKTFNDLKNYNGQFKKNSWWVKLQTSQTNWEKMI